MHIFASVELQYCVLLHLTFAYDILTSLPSFISTILWANCLKTIAPKDITFGAYQHIVRSWYISRSREWVRHQDIHTQERTASWIYSAKCGTCDSYCIGSRLVQGGKNLKT